MTKINDGGPAFPMQESQAIHAKAAAAIEGITDSAECDRLYTMARAAAVGGMSLRDYFATGVAVTDTDITVSYAETIVGRKMPDFARDSMANAVFWADVRARLRYIEADAMLAARGAE